MTPCKPALWKYRDARPYLMEAGKLITAKEAIRRVLVLRTPACAASPASRKACTPACSSSCRARSRPATAIRSRRCASSSKAPAPTPRSTASAPPCGRATSSSRPSWTWHDHGNPGNDPVVWMDGLDIRIVQTFAAQFHEVFPEEVQPVSRSEGASRGALRQRPRAGRRGGAVRQDLADLQLPLRAQPRVAGEDGARTRIPTPAMAGRWSSSTRSPAATPCRPSRPSSSCCPRASSTQPYRCTDGTIYSVVEGSRQRDHRRPELRFRAARHFRGAVLDAACSCRQRARRCCSPSPTAPARTRWACGGKNADERTGQRRSSAGNTTTGSWSPITRSTSRAGARPRRARAAP